MFFSFGLDRGCVEDQPQKAAFLHSFGTPDSLVPVNPAAAGLRHSRGPIL
jgi:hypothetical protein